MHCIVQCSASEGLRGTGSVWEHCEAFTKISRGSSNPETSYCLLLFVVVLFIVICHCFVYLILIPLQRLFYSMTRLYLRDHMYCTL